LRKVIKELKPFSKVFIAWYLILAYLAVVFILSSFPRPPYLGEVEKYIPDFVLHVVEYAILGFLLVRALGLSFAPISRWSLFILVTLLGTFYGFSDEWHQSFVPGRTPSIHDLLADAVGTMIGSALRLLKTRKNFDA
jgi:VanZ family protein